MASPTAEYLEPGKLLERRMSGSGSTAYRFALGSGEAFHVMIEQLGVDVVAALRGPDGELLAVDSPNGDRGPEHVFFVSEVEASYLLEVRPFGNSQGGAFRLLRESRPATATDRIRAAACRAMSEADKSLEGAAKKALRLYAEAIDGWRLAGEVYQEALTEAKLGKALSDLGEMRPSVRHRERALGLFESLGIRDQEPALRNDLGVAYEKLGQVNRARASFEAARLSARRHGNRREEITAINNLGMLEKDAGEPWRALVLLEEALVGWRDIGDSHGEAATLHNLGTLYTVLGKLPEARHSLEGALKIYRDSGRSRHQAATLMALGWMRFLEGDRTGGRAALLRSLELRRATGDRRGEAVSLDRLGTVSRELGELDRALSEYRQALAILDELEDQQSKAQILTNLGETLTAKGDPEAGRRHQDLALQLFSGQGQPSSEAYARYRRARAARALGGLDVAWADMQKAIQGLEGIRVRAQSDDLRMTYLDSVHELYEFAVDLLMELEGRRPGQGYAELALGMSERARARGLLDRVQAARGRNTSERWAAGSGDLKRLEQEIQAAEERQAVLVAGEDRRDSLAEEENRIRKLLREREKLLVGLRLSEANSEFEAVPLRAAEIQRRLLNSETVLLVYFLGETRSFLWAVGDRDIETAVLPPRALIEEASVRLHSLLAGSHLRVTVPQVRLTAEELSAVLLGPVARWLPSKRIVVVADGALAYVPFGALPDPTELGQPMIARHDVMMVPSASVLAAVKDRAAARELPSKLMAVVADPVFSLDDPRFQPGIREAQRVAGGAVSPSGGSVTRTVHDLGLRGLARLPFSRREAESILALTPPEKSHRVMGFAANLGLVMGGSLADFRIVHFATHALVHPKFPELSGIVLSLVDERGRPRPGFLRSYQIYSLHLPAELVVLSACRTGLGLELDGEGLVGLTQSFFHAGASRVLVSLWNVEDEATARLMERFYRELLGAGRTPAAALRVAQLSMRDDPRWSAPYHWAGFVLQGD